MNMNTTLFKSLFYGFSAVVIGVLAFFIVYNAGWITGDDAIVIEHTGWGHFFNPADTIEPAAGRFFPFAYIIYNILPFLQLYSVNAHFGLHALTFIIFSVVSIWVAYKAIDTKQFVWQDFVLVLSAAIVCIARAYCNFLDAFSTIWVDYTLVMIWVLCCYYVHRHQSLVAMVVGLLSVTWLTYCLETNFVFPLSYGIIGLLFTWNKSTRMEKAYLWGLVATGLLFLVLYFFICFLHIENAYDGSHGQEITIIGNAIKMFIAQKVLWVVLLLVCWRAYCIFAKKESFEFWDTILLTGCAYCCGCAIMKLNWVLYYSLASLFMVPAIVHYLHKYMGPKWAWIVMLALALFTFRKVPGYISQNQNDRKGTDEMINILVKQYRNGDNLYWYAPEDDREWCFDLEQRSWLHSCLEKLFAWEIDQEYYKLQEIKTFDGLSGTYILPCENNKLFPDINDTIISAGEMLKNGDLRSFTIVKVQ